MEGFYYKDIFETKGIEYLIIIGFFMVLIPFWMIINKPVSGLRTTQRILGALSQNLLRIPMGLFFNRNHTWAFMERKGFAKIGLDDFICRIVGDIGITAMKQPGEEVSKGEIVAEINQAGKKLNILSPVSGEIIRTNPVLTNSGEKLAEDPYNRGWIMEVKPTNWIADTGGCFFADEAANWFKKEMERFKDFLAVITARQSADPAMIVYQEGGEVRQNVLDGLNQEIWDEFGKNFMV